MSLPKWKRREQESLAVVIFHFILIVTFFKIIGYCAFAEIWHVHCFNIEVSYSGISRKQEMKIRISFVLGKASFVDVPKIWEPGSNVEGKVSSNLCYVI